MNPVQYLALTVVFWSFFLATLFDIFVTSGGFVLPLIMGIISGLIAHARGLNGIRFAAVGTIYAAMLGFPWLFLTFRILGWNIPRFLIRGIYVLPFGIWFGVGGSFAVLILSEAGFLGMATLAVVVGVGLVSLSVLRRTGVGPLSEWGSAEEGIVPYVRYIQPFAGLTIIYLVVLGGRLM